MNRLIGHAARDAEPAPPPETNVVWVVAAILVGFACVVCTGVGFGVGWFCMVRTKAALELWLN